MSAKIDIEMDAAATRSLLAMNMVHILHDAEQEV